MVAVEDEHMVLRSARDNLPAAAHDFGAVACERRQEIGDIHIATRVVLRGSKRAGELAVRNG